MADQVYEVLLSSIATHSRRRMDVLTAADSPSSSSSSFATLPKANVLSNIFQRQPSLWENALQTDEERLLLAIKAKLLREWAPEYIPNELRPPTTDCPDVQSERATNVTMDMIMNRKENLVRKTKIVCTLGPKCSSEEMLSKLVDAGMNAARLNSSMTSYEEMESMLATLKKVSKAKGTMVATMMNLEGYESRTSMLRDHQPITLEEGQEVVVQAVGAEHLSFEGYKSDKETRIGLSCASMLGAQPGNTVLLANGSIVLDVVRVNSETELVGRVQKTRQLGELKNCSLPGVDTRPSALSSRDLVDIEFACKHGLDFVAVPYVQSAEDVQRVRALLDSHGGQDIRIISKIENMAGLAALDEILAVTDGVTVARGHLGMDIPTEKVPVAQKLIITKCNIAGKFVIVAHQMLESMVANPRPTRAEMTDVANAVYDGCDAVMLSWETSRGDFPDIATSTMANIVAYAEQGVDYSSQHSFIKHWTTKCSSTSLSYEEAILAGAASMAVTFGEESQIERSKHHKRSPPPDNCIVCVTETGRASSIIAKYRPPCPVFVVSDNEKILHRCCVSFGLLPVKVEKLAHGHDYFADLAIESLKTYGVDNKQTVRVIVASGSCSGHADTQPVVSMVKSGPTMRKNTWSSSTSTVARKLASAHHGVYSFRGIHTGLPMLTQPANGARSTHILCTMGPSCWSEQNMNKLLDAGMDIIRLNFSHGSHEAHHEVLMRFRKVCASRVRTLMDKHGLHTSPKWASLLDTKGPEIRTSMLRDHKPIMLEAGQEVIVQAVGAEYVSFEGYKDDKETRIGLSYDKLCQSVKKGNRILLADGSISIIVEAILSSTELLGRVLSTAKLGERKNCNLPGVKIDIPVLQEKDIDDLVNFACKHGVTYVAASFVQSADDVEFIRNVLGKNGGQRIKIISKIESTEGLANFDSILQASDGIMVARGDLGMEIAPEQVPLAQKMMITKCNIAGKFVITATQMLESMVTNPCPTRAEMTDVANAVIDGTDCVMLSGETANGQFPEDAVATMAAICRNAEQMVEVHKRYDFLRNYTPKPMTANEAICSSAVQSAIDLGAKAIIIMTRTGRAPAIVSKFRPPMPIFVVTPDARLASNTRSVFGQHGVVVERLDMEGDKVVDMVAKHARALGLVDLQGRDQIVLVHRQAAGHMLVMRTLVVGDSNAEIEVEPPSYKGNKIIFHRSTKTGLSTIFDEDRHRHAVRKTKILCTMGPSCWGEEMLGKLMEAGMNVARLNFSHGDHKGHVEVLERIRKVAEAKGKTVATLLDTKGPEIRTAMLRDHKPILLEAGQEVIVQAVGAEYVSFEGYKDDKETRIGLSYDKLCQSVKKGNRILLADGSLSIEVIDIISDCELRGRVLNTKSLGERKNCNLPGVKVDIPVLTEKDIADLQNFACKHEMDFVAASFVQSKADVMFIRKVLDSAGGQHIKIISKIENAEGLVNFDEILEVTDGIMVARGDLGMEIPAEKVALAQKMMITKCVIAAKFVVVATQMLESMVSSPYPTRAEMTDVANAVFDGCDAVMLSGETANGLNPDAAVDVMARICRSAELGVNYYQSYDFVRQYTPRPLGTREAIVSAMSKNAVDIRPGMMVIFSDKGKFPRLLAKYRPPCPVLVVTPDPQTARSCSPLFAMHTMLMDAHAYSNTDLRTLVDKALEYGVSKGLCMPGSEVVVLTRQYVASGNPEHEMMIMLAPGVLDTSSLGELTIHSSALDVHYTHMNVSLRSTVIDLEMVLSPNAPPRKTKICITLGPSSSSKEVIRQLVLGGMDIARLPFSHETVLQQIEVLKTLREVCDETGRHIAIMAEAQGVGEVRSSYLLDGPKGERVSSLTLHKDDVVYISGTTRLTPKVFVGYKGGDCVFLQTNLEDIAYVVKEGQRIRMEDNVAMSVVEVTGSGQVKCVVLGECVLGEYRRMWIEGVHLHRPTVTEEHLVDIEEFVCRFNVDYLVASAVHSGSNIEQLRNFLNSNDGENVKIIAKIETANGLKNLDDIMDSVDGVLLARGALGMAIGSEKVALAQAMTVTRCNMAGKPVIVSRHMLESMMTNPRPTRAEMTDVANAVMDGVDCVMLCDETASGQFPVECLATAARIVRNAEHATNYAIQHSFIHNFAVKPFKAVETASMAFARAVGDAGLGLAVVISDGGIVASLIAKYRPPVPVVVVSSQPQVILHCRLVFGAYGFYVEDLGSEDLKPLLKRAAEWAVSEGLVDSGASVAIMHGLSENDADRAPVMQVLQNFA